jgi:hypothetical protein
MSNSFPKVSPDGRWMEFVNIPKDGLLKIDAPAGESLKALSNGQQVRSGFFRPKLILLAWRV